MSVLCKQHHTFFLKILMQLRRIGISPNIYKGNTEQADTIHEIIISVGRGPSEWLLLELVAKIVPTSAEHCLWGNLQGCSPRDLGLGLGLESTRNHFYAVLVLVLILMVSVLVSVLKDWSRIFSRPVLYKSICFFFGIFHRKKKQLQKSFAAYTCVTSAALAKLQRIPRPSPFTSRRNGRICN